MGECLKFYIDGKWTDPIGGSRRDIVDPASEKRVGEVALGSAADVDAAVAAARAAFPRYAATTREERIDILERLAAGIEDRFEDLANAVTMEMGAPGWLARDAHVPVGLNHLRLTIDALRSYAFERPHGNTMIRFVPIGVCGLITAWNWPIAVVMTKLAPALAAGCTVVLKPSEYAAFSAKILADIVDGIGLPPGVFNMLFGEGPTVGGAMSSHPDIDMISITGSTRAGIDVARRAADTVKRVHQELGGKNPNLILPSADLASSVEKGVKGLMVNSGQTCAAPSRMLVPNSRIEEAKAIARAVTQTIEVGAPDSNAFIGPVVNEAQYQRIQNLIETGIAEGATLVAGGPGRPDGLEAGYFVRPTVFADTAPDMAIVREEIFGPVLVLQGYDMLEDGIRLAVDTDYGLAAYVQGADLEELRSVGDALPAGQVFLNGSGLDLLDQSAPFGGFKKSGNGREWGEFGLEAFLETKAFIGFVPA